MLLLNKEGTIGGGYMSEVKNRYLLILVMLYSKCNVYARLKFIYFWYNRKKVLRVKYCLWEMKIQIEPLIIGVDFQ